jgi:hypothetical protein
MITNIDELKGTAFRKANADFRIMLLQFAESHDMTQEAMKSFVAMVGEDFSYQLQRGYAEI